MTPHTKLASIIAAIAVVGLCSAANAGDLSNFINSVPSPGQVINSFHWPEGRLSEARLRMR